MDALRLSRLKSPIHTLNPLVKLLVVVLYWLVALITLNPLVTGSFIILAVCCYPLSRLSLSTVRILLMILIPIFIIFIIFNGFLYDIGGAAAYGSRSGGTVLFTLWKWPFTLGGLWFGVRVDLKILSIVLMIPLFTMTTSLPKFMAALAKLKLPYKFIFTLGIAMRLVPLIISTYQDILAAQRLRGYDLSEMNYFKRIVKGYVPLFIPLVLTMLRRTSDMDIAIESRGFGAPVQRTYLQDITPTGRDWVILTGVILFFGLVFTYIFFWGGLSFGLVSGLAIQVTPTAVP
jgi:energy-coupling factor transport system permease protein